MNTGPLGVSFKIDTLDEVKWRADNDPTAACASPLCWMASTRSQKSFTAAWSPGYSVLVLDADSTNHGLALVEALERLVVAETTAVPA